MRHAGPGHHRGDPPATVEAERIDWIPLDRVPGFIAGGQIRSAVTAAALMLPHHRGPAVG